MGLRVIWSDLTSAVSGPDRRPLERDAQEAVKPEKQEAGPPGDILREGPVSLSSASQLMPQHLPSKLVKAYQSLLLLGQ